MKSKTFTNEATAMKFLVRKQNSSRGRSYTGGAYLSINKGQFTVHWDIDQTPPAPPVVDRALQIGLEYEMLERLEAEELARGTGPDRYPRILRDRYGRPSDVS